MALRDKYITALEKLGAQKVESKSRRYVTMTRKPIDGEMTFYFIGKSGALRVGRTVTGSVPASEKFKKLLLEGVKLLLLGVLLFGTCVHATEEQEAIWQHQDSGIGSYSNVYGHGWTKVCCDYPYYYPYHHRRPRHNTNGEKK